MTTIRELGPREGLLLRDLRLAALKDAPDAFSPTWEENARHDDDYWHGAAERISSTPGFTLFIAEIGGTGVGLASAQADPEGIGHIGAMWASPTSRGLGVGSALLDTAISFLSNVGCAEIHLTVTETNAHAIALYESRGFRMTGGAEPLREGSLLLNLEMSRQGR